MKLTPSISLPQPQNHADLAAAREARCRADVLRVAFRFASARTEPHYLDRKVPRAELLRRLPHWTHSAINKALKRLEAEGLIASSEYRVPAHKAWALTLTGDGVKSAKDLTPDRTALLDELVARLRRRPDRIDAALRAITSDVSTGGY